jgi:hypothetical protein
MSSNDVQFKKLTHWVNNRRQKKNDKSDNSSSSGNDESAAASVPVVSKKRRVGGVVTSVGCCLFTRGHVPSAYLYRRIRRAWPN